MGYLIRNDLLKVLQANQLTQLLTGNDGILEPTMQAAVDEACSFLRQKYLVAAEFTNTTVWDYAKEYTAGDRVYLDADTYNASDTYTLNSLTKYLSGIYINAEAVTVPEAFNPTKWTLLGAQYEMFYVTYPYPLFNYLGLYNVGSQIFYNGYNYTALKATQYLSHGAELQAGQIINPKVLNVFPGNYPAGIQAWGVGTAYTIPAGTLPTDSTKWTEGDNRDQMILQKVIDACLYHLHTRIAPQNIPIIRVVRYKGSETDVAISAARTTYPVSSALGWYQAAAEGQFITAALPRIQPNSGMRMRYGGVPKSINQY